MYDTLKQQLSCSRASVAHLSARSSKRHVLFLHGGRWEKKACCTFSKHLDIILASHTHVYNALVCDHTPEPCSHVLHLHLLRVTGAPPGGLGPRGGLCAVGLSQARAPPGGVNPWVSAAAAVLPAVSATGNIQRKEHLFIRFLTKNRSYTLFLNFFLNPLCKQEPNNMRWCSVGEELYLLSGSRPEGSAGRASGGE